jgi:hypothetical protein
MTLFRAGVFVGLVPVLLAFVGFVRRRPGAGLGRWLSIGTLLVATGAPVVAWLAYTFIPGVSRLTTTGYTLWLFDFGLVVLAALGLDAVLQWPARLAAWLRRGNVDLARFVPLATVLVAVLALGGTAVQLVRYARYINPPFTTRQADNLYPTTPAIAAIQHDRAHRAATDPQRLLGFTALYGDQSLVFSLEDADGYDAIVPSRVRSLWRAVEGGTSIDRALNAGSSGSFLTVFDPQTTRYWLLPRIGVTTIIARPSDVAKITAARVTSPVQLAPVYAGRDASVFNIVGAPPRAWVVHESDVVNSQSAALHRFADRGFDYRARMIVEGSQGIGPPGHTLRRGSGDGPVARRANLTANGATFTVDTPTAGWLVMADIYAPGWSVTVNGTRARLLRANYAFRAVPVPAGRSRVILRYRSPGLALGAVLSGTAALALFIIGATWLGAATRRSRRLAAGA